MIKIETISEWGLVIIKLGLLVLILFTAFNVLKDARDKVLSNVHAKELKAGELIKFENPILQALLPMLQTKLFPHLLPNQKNTNLH